MIRGEDCNVLLRHSAQTKHQRKGAKKKLNAKTPRRKGAKKFIYLFRCAPVPLCSCYCVGRKFLITQTSASLSELSTVVKAICCPSGCAVIRSENNFCRSISWTCPPSMGIRYRISLPLLAPPMSTYLPSRVHSGFVFRDWSNRCTTRGVPPSLGMTDTILRLEDNKSRCFPSGERAIPRGSSAIAGSVKILFDLRSINAKAPGRRGIIIYICLRLCVKCPFGP
jgi:hypothetical protein